MLNRFDFGVGGIFSQGIVNDAKVCGTWIVAVNNDAFHTRFQNLVHVICFNNHFAIEDNLVPFDRNNFTSIVIYEILEPGFDNPGGQFPSYNFFQVSLIHLNFIGETEDFKNILIGFITDGTE